MSAAQPDALEWLHACARPAPSAAAAPPGELALRLRAASTAPRSADAGAAAAPSGLLPDLSNTSPVNSDPNSILSKKKKKKVLSDCLFCFSCV